MLDGTHAEAHVLEHVDVGDAVELVHVRALLDLMLPTLVREKRGERREKRLREKRLREERR